MTATAGSALETVLAALDRAGCRYRPEAGQYKAQYPAHEDRNPSLSVKYENDKVLVYCHVGCTFDQVLDALGLHQRDLRDATDDDGRQTQRKGDAHDRLEGVALQPASR
ncbi:MAG: hypothetical protein ACRDQU_06885 [Pseudonocardiaceae bacterium]